MFAKITENRVNEALIVVNRLGGYDYESIMNSNLGDFTKNFVLLENNNYSTKETLMKSVEKSVKLLINYTVRPKWTLLNYIFGSIDSKPSREIMNKVEIFTFYHYYLEMIRSIASDNEQVSVKKLNVESAIDSVNKDIYEKLTSDITSLKIKNLFVQVFKLKYGDQTEISLDMSVPFSFIKLFLEDKGYNDLLVKFGSDFDEFTDVELKTIIKILSGKYFKYENTEALKVDDVFIQTSTAHAEKHNVQTAGVIEKTEEPFKETVKEPVEDFVKRPVKKFFEEPAKVNAKESFKETVKEVEKNVQPEPEKFETPHDAYTQEEKQGHSLRYLFKEDEIRAISKKVFNGQRTLMIDALEEIEKLNSWRETTGLLKNIFKNNKVNYYDKNVILFVDILSDYFEKRER
ncbi:MAG: hypothetical protein PHN88_08010 [Ignavibacteria bacterium]|nr:hypothetical protein [Ignavibacteria bacterium]